ncbi:MAG: hypothetical protein HGB11_07465, partial [Chlorobiales bacterium]|nr:hypothetical protein [Chlorobiales bacterium]
MAKLCPELPENYLKGLLELKSMGAVVMTLALKQPLSNEGFYWFNVPKEEGYPFLALVEHTNFVPKENFGGDYIVYAGDYLELGHEYFSMSDEELLERFIPAFQKFNPEFKRDWVKKIWVFKTNYAQPVPLVNHSQNIPPLRTPVPGLLLAGQDVIGPGVQAAFPTGTADDGKLLAFQVILEGDPYSSEALEQVRELRTTAREAAAQG